MPANIACDKNGDRLLPKAATSNKNKIEFYVPLECQGTNAIRLHYNIYARTEANENPRSEKRLEFKLQRSQQLRDSETDIGPLRKNEMS